LQKILFVINPVAGGKTTNVPGIISHIESNLAQDISYEVKVWESLDQNQEIHDMILSGNYSKVAAVGGDGTINFIAQAAIKAGIPMGIVPKGSGNGLARHLGLPLDEANSIKTVIHGRETLIDTGIVNGNLFLCTSGAGFDALIGDLFSKSTTRGLVSYAKISLQQLINYKPRECGYDVQDLGSFSGESVDYPDFAHKLAEEVAAHEGQELGILMCGSGNGVCMTANKHQGIRAALAWNPEIASLARQHNNANVLCLPARFITEAEARDIINAYLGAHSFGTHCKKV